MYCSKCGSEISASATFCPMCGQGVSGLTPAAPAAMAVAPAYAVPIPATYIGPLYAGFWLRFVALLIDRFVCGLIFVILLVPVILLTGAGSVLSRIGSGEDLSDEIATLIGVGFMGGFFALIILIGWLYRALCESSSWQGTVGKKLLGLYVTDMAGQPISFGRASGRYFARFVSWLIPLFIGYILAGFTEKKQAIHDMIAGCLVLRRS